MKHYLEIYDGLLAEYAFSSADNAKFWEDHWGKQKIRMAIDKASKGYLNGMTFMLDELRQDDKILEAGCGRGQNLAALKARGFQVFGIDFADSIIREIKEIRPDLDVRTGDLKDLPFGDGEFTVYLSFGVLEHFVKEEDVKTIINEAKRVTSQKIFISVPYLSPVLIQNYRRDKLDKNVSEGIFYQYYFSQAEIKNLLCRNGLIPYKTVFYGTYLGLKKYNGVFSFFLRFTLTRYLMFKSYRLWDRIFGSVYAHMIGIWSYNQSR